MATCPNCGIECAPEELIRHELARMLIVQCPECNRVLGRYRRHGDDPEIDRYRAG